MNVIDYSQFGEQLVIEEFFNGEVGHFLDIGAFDGKEGSNSLRLVELGWKGLCIEPDPVQFLKLLALHKDNPNVQLLNCAVTHSVSRVTPFWGGKGQCSTARPDIGARLDNPTRYNVAGLCARDIAVAFGIRWDFVSIDTEQLENEVLVDCAPLLLSTRLLCVEECRRMDDLCFSHIKLAFRSMGFTRDIMHSVVAGKPEFANFIVAKP